MNLPAFIQPQKLVSQLLASLFLAVVIAFVIAIVVTLRVQQINTISNRDKHAAERVAELTSTIEALSLENRTQFAKAARTRTTTVRVGDMPSVMTTANNARSRILVDAITTTLERTNVRASVLPGIDFDVNGDPRDSGRNREVIAVSIPLTPSGWLNFNARQPLTWYTRADQYFLFLVFGTTMALVIGFAAFFVRRITRPVEAIAVAARRAAAGDRSARIKSEGPIEFRHAAVAFNTMQSEIEQAEAERVRTLAAVGHDLRTPITSLRVRTEMIENDNIKKPMIKTLEDMIVMADGLVEYARSKQVENYTEQLKLHELVASLAEEYKVDFQSDVHPIVTGGPVSLTRALRNLIENAIRYATPESVTLSESDGVAMIKIYDSGPGIDESTLETIVEPFVRGDSSRSTDTGGSGLGLTIAREIIQSHGGKLRLDNRRTGGLCATVTIPISQE